VNVPVVAVWRSILLPGSETFVRNQADAMTRWRPVFVGAATFDSVLARDTDVTASGRWPFLWLRATGRSGAIRRLLAAQEARLVHAHFAGDGWLISRTAVRLGLPLVITLHGRDVTLQANAPGLRGVRYRRNLRTAFRRAALVLAVSEPIRQRAIALGADPAKVRVHHIGVPAPAPMDEELVGEKAWDVLFVGRFVAKKGVDDLVEALGTLRDRRPRVLFIGGGPLEEPIRKRAAELGLDATFLGPQDPDVVARSMAAARIFASPSKTAPDGDSEGLPTTIVEAARRGLPAVSTVHSGIPEVVLHGETGLLGPEGDRDALAANLRTLLADDELRVRLGARAKEFADANFDLATQTRLLEDLYSSLPAGATQNSLPSGSSSTM
jgi:glycosyltransferase involved in cell wall biosynthesis